MGGAVHGTSGCAVTSKLPPHCRWASSLSPSAQTLPWLGPACGRNGRRLKRLAKMRENLADEPQISDEREQPDVAATVWARKRKLLSHPGHQFRLGNPGGVV